MGWNGEETTKTKSGMRASSKVLLGMIACIMLIIVLIIILLMNMQGTTFKMYLNDSQISKEKANTLFANIDGVTYFDIEKLSKLVGYEYHKGEYKASSIDENKCYVEGITETTSFYLNENKIYKLLVNEQTEQYKEYTVENKIKSQNDIMYVPADAASIAFNILILEEENGIKIYTLDYLINIYDSAAIKWGYTTIKEETFENQKAILYGCLIVKKEGGLYKIIDTNNTKEIVLDRYTEIKFSENTQEFFVKDTFNKVGVINLDGTTKIEPAYDSILVLDKELDLYVIEQEKKYGVVAGNGKSVIYPEYDSIGLNNSNIVENKYLILDELIPVYKDKKWGVYNKNGQLIFDVAYDEIGYTLNSIEINGVKEVVQPVIAIKRANAIVLKQSNKYGLFDVTGRELVRLAVDGIYAANGVKDEEERYFMLYNGEELNVIKRLIEAGLIEEKVEENPSEELENTIPNIVANNLINELNGTLENAVNNEV